MAGSRSRYSATPRSPDWDVNFTSPRDGWAIFAPVRVERHLVQQLARQPRAEEIAAELEMTTAEVREILRTAKLPLSLENPVGEEDDAKLGDFVEHEVAEFPLRRGLGLAATRGHPARALRAARLSAPYARGST